MIIQVGQAASVNRTFGQSDFDRFAALSGDDNPIHVDPGFAAQTRFGGTVAHGMFLYSVVCGLLSTELPGPGTVQLEQELMFPSATLTGEEVEIRVEVTEVEPVRGLVDLTTLVTRPDGSHGLEGRTRVRLPDSTTPLSSGTTARESATGEARTFKGLRIGQQAETRRTFGGDDLAEYTNLTGDRNPIFGDRAQAGQAGLDGPAIPGGLVGSLFSFLLGTRLPGRGTNYLKQRLEFPSHAFVGQPLVASVEITRIRPEKQLVNLRTICSNAAGHLVCQGEALVLIRDVEGKP